MLKALSGAAALYLAASKVMSFLLAPRQPGWRLDWPSLLIGFFLGLLLALAVYMLRTRIAAARDAVRNRAQRVQERLSGGVEEWYREQVTAVAESTHLLKRYASLADMYISRRLAVPYILPAALQPPEGAQDRAMWAQMRFYDLLHPSPSTVTLEKALEQHRKLAFLGPVGSGRTTMLAHLAQVFARRAGWELTLPPPQEGEPPEAAAARERERERLPVWISLSALDLSSAEREGRHVLIEPIIDSVAAALPGLTAHPAAALVRSRLVAGECILFLDDLDLLAPEAWPRAVDWLDRLARAYPENVFIVSGGVTGYAALSGAGFAPLILGGLERFEAMDLIGRWERARERLLAEGEQAKRAAAQKAYQAAVAQARREGKPPPAEEEFLRTATSELPPPLLDVWPAGRRTGVLPLELALVALLWREQNEVPAEPLLRYAQAVLLALNRLSDKLLKPQQWARILSTAAWSMQVDGQYYAGREILERPIVELLDQAYAASAEFRTRAEGEEDEKPDFGPQARAAVDAFVAPGDLVVDAGRGRLSFVHPVVQAYLAAQHAARSNEVEALTAHVGDPRWEDVFSFYSALSNATPLAVAWLKKSDDLFRTGFLAAARALAVSSQTDKRLQGKVLGELSHILLDPMQPALLGRWAATAVAASKDQGALYLFGQAMQHRDPHIRRLGVCGLAQMEHERVLVGLQHALSDPDSWVRIEALYALGAMGGSEVIDGLVRGLQDADELVRRVAAEALATCGDEGCDLLREGVEHEDMYLRRAAIFGLGKVRQPWVAPLVDQVRRQDQEWFVRSAATEILDSFHAPPPDIVPRASGPQTVGWLVAWAGRQGLPLDSDAHVLHALGVALQAEDWTLRLAAADILRIYGGQEAISVLKPMIRDENPTLREAAYNALHAISVRTLAFLPR